MTAGFAATLIMSGLVTAAPSLGSPDLAHAWALSLLELRAHPWVALFGLTAHLAYGSLAGGLFAVAARQITLKRSVLFGLGLWGVAVAVYAPLIGLGFIAARAPALAVLAIPLHVAYGIALGALAPPGEIVHPVEDALIARAS